MHDGNSAKVNIQPCNPPWVIAQREVLIEASIDRNTSCDSSHGAIRCMQKWNDTPQPGSLPNENKIRALACFSCASIRVFLLDLVPLVGLKPYGREKKTSTPHEDIRSLLERNHSPLHLHPSPSRVSQANQKYILFLVVVPCQDKYD